MWVKDKHHMLASIWRCTGLKDRTTDEEHENEFIPTAAKDGQKCVN